jgi:predicted transcriptional regulator
MAKLINKTQNNFTIINNTITRDKRLGIKERGLLLTLLSLPDNWNFSVAGICSILPDGKATINATIKTLEEYGYLSRVQLKNKNGQFCGYDWLITDTTLT